MGIFGSGSRGGPAAVVADMNWSQNIVMPLTFTVWVYYGVAPGIGNTIYSFQNNSFGTTREAAFTLYGATDNTGKLVIEQDINSSTGATVVTTSAVPTNTWVFVAARFRDQSFREIRVFNNGSLILGTPLSDSTNLGGSGTVNAMIIGSGWRGFSSTTNAVFAEFAMFAQDVQPNDLQLLASGANPLAIGAAPTLQWYLPLRDSLDNYGNIRLAWSNVPSGTAIAYGPHPFVDQPPTPAWMTAKPWRFRKPRQSVIPV